MKIAQLGARCIPPKHGGLEVVVDKLSEELSRLGYEVIVYVGDNSDELSTTMQVVQVWSSPGKYIHTASQMLSSLRAVKRGSFDLIHIHGVGPAFILLLWPFRRVPVYVTAHGIDWNRKKWPHLASKLFKAIARTALQRADSVSAVSMATAADLGAEINKSVRYIENGIELPPPVSTEALQLPEHYSVVLSRLTPEKNIESVVQYWDDIVAAIHGPLVIIGGGGGSYSGEYEELLRSQSTDNVIWLGQVERTLALSVLRNAALFISMSRLEAQPMAVLEAASLRVPMILSDLPAHREICGESATYIALNDKSGLYRELVNRGSTPTKAPANDLFHSSWAEVAAKYSAWFKELGD